VDSVSQHTGSSETDDAPVFRNYPRGAIKEVVLGERIPEAYRSEVLGVIEKIYAGVPAKNGPSGRRPLYTAYRL